MFRELTSHKVNGCNESLQICVMDAPGSGGASHAYNVYGFHAKSNPSADAFNNDDTCLKVLFQNGPIKEAGVNGITQEALLAIIEDRLVGFQSGPYACADNAEALDHIRAAMECLQRRTKARIARGVEGTHEK